ncbi:MAG: molybdopterin-binding protein [Gammaproteobacteria bacterium]
MTDVQLLDKTEIWVRGLALADADLPALARAAAAALSIPADKMFVTDVRGDVVVFDVLVPQVRLEDVGGRKRALLDALGAVPGVTVAQDASVHSEGVLGVIGLPAEEVPGVIAATARIEAGLREYTARRVAVVTTGGELASGQVRDTNIAAVSEILGAAGFEVQPGGMVPDDVRAIAGRVARLAQDGFGIVITTGGVGAEDKDCTIEAMELLDPDLATAVLARYTRGHGRHVKDSVRIAIARIGWSIAVALPGPTHEVRLALPVLVEGLTAGAAPAELVESIAVPLRGTLPAHGHAHGHGHA